jgi:hypothetical protein
MSKKQQQHSPKGIGELAEDKLLAGWPDAAILRAVHVQFADAETTLKNIQFYRADARKRGLEVPTAAQAKKRWAEVRALALRELGADPIQKEVSAKAPRRKQAAGKGRVAEVGQRRAR